VAAGVGTQESGVTGVAEYASKVSIQKSRTSISLGSSLQGRKPSRLASLDRCRQPRANEPKIDLAGLLERIGGIDLTKVVGLHVLNVLLIVSEIGVDMGKWRSAKAFCSWLGLCPGNKISGGKVLDSRTRQVVNRVANALRLAAQSVGRTQTSLSIFYRRKQAHLGAPKATTATARKLACLIYHLLKYKQPYQEPDPAIYQLRLQKSALSKLQKQAASLGYTLLPTAPLPG
jgi:transposase